MSVLLNTATILLLALFGIGFYLSWYQFLNNGSQELLEQLRDSEPRVLPYTNGAPLRTHFTGITLVDDQLTVLAIFFYNVVDGSHPNASLQCYQFAGQFFAIWNLVLLEGLRGGHNRRIISFTTIWGLLMQNAAFLVVMPIYLTIHLMTSPTVRARNPSDFLVEPSQIVALLFSVAIGFVVPSVLTSLPAPSVISSDTKQIYMTIFQMFPIWVCLLQVVLPITWKSFVGSNPKKSKTLAVSYLRLLYIVSLMVAGITWISTWTLSIGSVLFPGLVSSQLAPSAVFTPIAWSPTTKMPSIAAGALLFLQCDEMVSAIELLVWSLALYSNVSQSKTFLGRLSMFVKAMVILVNVGPFGLAVAAVWARDEVIFADYAAEKKDL